ELPAARKSPAIVCAGLGWTFPGPAHPRLTPHFGSAPGTGQISLLPAHLPGGSHFQMEGFQAEGGLEPPIGKSPPIGKNSATSACLEISLMTPAADGPG